jgi:hypothetical protein
LLIYGEEKNLNSNSNLNSNLKFENDKHIFLDILDKIKNDTESAYKLISKSGWVYRSSASASDKRKQKIYMMASGSSFNFKPIKCNECGGPDVTIVSILFS